MYNPQKIIKMIERSGISKKTLLGYLGMRQTTSIERVIQGDIRVSKLEKIADFFGVSIDEFFDRQPAVVGLIVSGERNNVHHFNVSAENESLHKLLDEKDKRIALLEDMVAVLKAARPTE